MHITKSQIVLQMTEGLLDQEDQAILDGIYRQTGLVLEELTDTELEVLMNEGVSDYVNAIHQTPLGQGAVKHASTAWNHVSNFAQTPHGAAIMAGGALALGAAAALRRRSRNKAAAKAAGQ